MWAGVHLVRGRHVILRFGGLIEDFVAEATLDLRRFASVFGLDVRTQARLGKLLVTRNAKVRVPTLFLFVIFFQGGQGIDQILLLQPLI